MTTPETGANATADERAIDTDVDAADEMVALFNPADEAPQTRRSRRELRSADDELPDEPLPRTPLNYLVPLGLVALAAAPRFIGLDHPHTLVFDETYYVKDAFTLSQLGYEGKWGDDANAGFVAGKPDFSTDAAYVVHPPLGKWIIAAGLGLFGAGNGWGWRGAVALAGVITVLLTYFLAKRLTRSGLWGGLAGFFVAIDGVAIVMSRIALLDGILTMFIVLGVYFIALDRRYLKQLEYPARTAIGSILWNRPWIIAAGVAFGAASAVKWSGAYALAGFGIYLVVTDAFARYQTGATRWWWGSLYQGAISFVYLVPTAILTYLASWTGWFVTSGGFNRDREGGAFAALLDYHRQMLEFHNGLSSSHTYMSPAWQWPFLIRPTAMYWESETEGVVQAITPIPNPLLWWAGVIAVFYLLYRFAYKPTWSIPIVLTAIAVAYLPWLALPNRTIFQFYTVVMVPFLAIALVMAMKQLAGTTKDPSPPIKRWRIAIIVFIAVATLLSIFFYPLWTGMEISRDFWKIHMWFPSWI